MPAVLILALFLLACSTAQYHAAISSPADEREALRAEAAFYELAGPLLGTIIYTPGRTVHCAEVSTFSDSAEVVFDDREMQTIRQRYGDEAVFGIFSHELGHVLNKRLGSMPDDSWHRELIADRWAGCALAVARMSPEPLSLWLTEYAAAGSKSHPPGVWRAAEVHAGFDACNGH